MGEGRLIFKDSDELLRFLRGLSEIFGVTTEEDSDDEEATDEEATDEEANNTHAVSLDGSHTAPGQAKFFAKVNIPEGSPAANQIASAIRDIYGEDTEVSFEPAPQSTGHYDPERRLYHLNDEVYGEHAVIWFPIPAATYFDVTYEYDPADQEQPIVVPLDTAKLNRHQPRISLERDYQAAFELVKTKDTPGTVAICFDGKFYIPCTGFYNTNDEKTEYLINVFNVKSCEANSRDLYTMLTVNVGNITNVLPFKFACGTEIDWYAAVDYLLRGSNDDGYDDKPIKLFDDFEDSLIKKEPAPPSVFVTEAPEQKQPAKAKKSKPSKKSSETPPPPIKKSEHSDQSGA